MEVHHHPHVGKKSFKEYILEGLMIFLAVSMGFIAEGIRENMVRHEKEFHLMEILLKDLKEDTTRMNASITNTQAKVAALDTLARLCFKATKRILSDSQYRKMYYFMRRYGFNSTAFLPTNRAVVLLDKGDAFSLIKKQNISDSILYYQDLTKVIEHQYSIYYENRNGINETGKQLFDYRLMLDITGGSKAAIILQSTEKYPLLSNDKSILQLYASGTLQVKGLLNNYLNYLQLHRNSAANLIEALKKEYHLEKE